MLSGDVGSNIIRILTRKGNISSLARLGEGLSQGQTLKGKVLDVLSGGKALIDLNGQKLTVEAETPLIKGQTIQVRVDQLKPNPVLKLIPPTAAKEAGSPGAPAPAKGEAPVVQARLNNQLPEGLVLKKADAVALKLQPGQELQASFVKTVNPEVVEVKIQGKTFPALVSKNTTLPRVGENLALQVRNSREGLILETAPPAVRILDSRALKPYLPARQDFGAMAVGLEKEVLDSGSLKAARIDPQLVQRMKETLDVLLARESPDAGRLKEQVDRSGINYEAKVKRVLENKITPEGRLELAKDLKGQLLKLQNLLEKFIASESSRLPEPTLNAVRETASQVKMAADNIELHQLSNQFSRQENQPVLIQIPDPFFPENRSAKLYVRRDEGEEGRSGSGKKDYNLVFLLDMSAVGNLRVDARVGESKVSAKIGSENQKVVDFMSANAPQLKDKLEEMGYQAEVTCCIQEPTAMKVEDGLEKVLVRDPARLIDVKT